MSGADYSNPGRQQHHDLSHYQYGSPIVTTVPQDAPPDTPFNTSATMQVSPNHLHPHPPASPPCHYPVCDPPSCSLNGFLSALMP